MLIASSKALRQKGNRKNRDCGQHYATLKQEKREKNYESITEWALIYSTVRSLKTQFSWYINAITHKSKIASRFDHMKISKHHSFK